MEKSKKRRTTVCVIAIICLVIFGGTATMGIINYSKNQGYVNKIIDAMDDNDVDRFNELLAKKGNINSRRSVFPFLTRITESDDSPPLSYACWLAKFEFVEPLLIRGSDPNLEKQGTSVLTLCLLNVKKDTEEKMLNAIKLLIEYGADVNYRDEAGVSVLRRVEVELNSAPNSISDEIKQEVFKLLVDSGAQK